MALTDIITPIAEAELKKIRDAVAAATHNDNRLPDSSFKAQYPWNATHVSRSGHEFHVDDTPGAERIRQAHRTGSYWELALMVEKLLSRLPMRVTTLRVD
jgi:hypothetical protein